MKKIVQLLTFLFVLSLIGCSQIDYNNPLDSTVNYEPKFFQDSNNNGIADYWDPESEIYKSNLDTIPPELVLTGPNPALIPNGDPNHLLENLKTAYTVKDARDPNPKVEVTNTEFSVIFPDTNFIYYTARDVSTNDTTLSRMVIILPQEFKDTVEPQISASTINPEIYQNEQFDQMKNVKAYDAYDGDITEKITISGSVDITKAGEYTLTYKVQDKAGNEAILVRKVTVIKSDRPDNDFPVITLTGGDTVIIKEKETWVEPGYKAEDPTEGDITGKVQTSGTVKTTPGWSSITYTVSDNSMNISSKTRYVKREGTIVNNDTMSPSIELKYQKDTLVTVIKGTKFVIPDLNIYDNVDGQIPKDSVKIFGNLKTDTKGTYPIALTVKDKADNEGRLDIKVKVVDGVVDETRPVITLKGKNPDTVSVHATATYKDSGATVTDNIDKNLTATVKGSVDRKTAGTYTLTYTASDAAGNADTVKRIVVVKQSSSSDLLEKYQVPGTAALPTLDKSYTSATIEGDESAAPNLSNMTSFAINWNKSQNSVYSIALNMPNPINYVDLKEKMTQTFGKAGPTIKFTGVTQIAKLDGEYYVAMDGTSFVMVKTDGSFAIIMK